MVVSLCGCGKFDLLLAHSFANKKDHLLLFSLKLDRVFTGSNPCVIMPASVLFLFMYLCIFTVNK
jgi:hypothetical protein